MLLKYTFPLTLYFFGFVFENVECQICTKRVVITQWKQESYYYTYRERYNDGCWYCRTKTRIKTVVDYKTVPRKVVETRPYCCNGYIDVGDTSDSVNCKPICMPACKNGYCVSPGKCSCDLGYELDPRSDHSCRPICNNVCSHGKCVSPNLCQCDDGYSKVNETCQPICSEACTNGICTAPGTCECLPGYRKSENNICEPYCFSGCPNGKCISPDNCVCNTGWIKKEESNSCVAQCKIPCGNGTCVAPDRCECFTGYEIEPNYNETFSATLCVPSCYNCVNGTCTAPNECTCEPPFIAKQLSKNSDVCDCTTDCTNSSTQCDKIVCIEEEITTSTYFTVDITGKPSQPYDENYSTESATSRLTITSNDIYFPEKTPSTLETTFFTELEWSDAETTNVLKDNSNDSFIKNNTNNSLLKLSNGHNDKRNIWIYSIISLFILVAVLLMIISVMKRNSIANWWKGGSYVVQDDKLKDIASATQTYDISYKNIMSKKKHEYN